MAKRHNPRVSASRQVTNRLRPARLAVKGNVVAFNTKKNTKRYTPMSEEHPRAQEPVLPRVRMTREEQAPEVSKTKPRKKGGESRGVLNDGRSKARTTHSFRQRVMIYELIKSMDPLTPASDYPGQFRYKAGMTDQTVAAYCQEKLEFDVSVHNVSRIREELYGPLVKETPTDGTLPPSGMLLQTIKEHGAAIKQLQLTVSELSKGLAQVGRTDEAEVHQLIQLLTELNSKSSTKKGEDSIGVRVIPELAEALVRINRLESLFQTIARVDAGIHADTAELEEVRRNKVTPRDQLREGGVGSTTDDIAERLSSKFRVTKDDKK